MALKVGDKVKFKTWEDLKEEFGLTNEDNIDCNYIFTQEMDRVFEDRDTIYIITGIDGDRINIDSPFDYVYSEDMFELVVSGDEGIMADNFVDGFSFNTLEAWHVKRIPNYTIDWSCDNGTSTFPIKDRLNKYNNKLKNILRLMFLQEGLVNKHSIHVYINDYVNSPNIIWDHFYQDSIMHTKIVILTNTDPQVRHNKYEEYSQYEKESEAVELLLQKENYVFYKNASVLLCYMEPDYFLDDNWMMDLFTVIFNNMLRTTDDHFKTLFSQGKFDECLVYCASIKEKLVEEEKRKHFDEILEEILKKVEKSFLYSLGRRITEIKEEITRYEREIVNLYNDLREKLKTEAYFKAGAIERNNCELVELLKSDYKNISNIDINEEVLKLSIVQPLLFFDDEDWGTVKNNVLKRYCNTDTQYVISAIFDRKCEILLETGVWISIDGQVSFGNYNSYNNKYGIPNSHISRYNCWGDNKNPIRKALQDGKYDIVYAQIKSALAGINVIDTPVMENFCYAFDNDDYRNIVCIKDYETEKMMSIQEANVYYKELEEK